MNLEKRGYSHILPCSLFSKRLVVSPILFLRPHLTLPQLSDFSACVAQLGDCLLRSARTSRVSTFEKGLLTAHNFLFICLILCIEGIVSDTCQKLSSSYTAYYACLCQEDIFPFFQTTDCSSAAHTH